MEYKSRFYEQRFRFTCPNKHILICDVPAEDRILTGNDFVQHLYNSNGTWQYSKPYPIACPECGCPMYPKIFKVRAKVTDKPCGTECLCARGEVCNCSCGGENHGLKYLYYLSQHGGLSPVGVLPG